jgi:hypothetical protein
VLLPESNPVIAAQPAVCVGYIAAAGIHIDCLPITSFDKTPDVAVIPLPATAVAKSAIDSFFVALLASASMIAILSFATFTAAAAKSFKTIVVSIS